MSESKSACAENDDYIDEKEEDSRVISVDRNDDYDESEDLDYKSYALPQQIIRGMGLDLSLAPAKGDEKESGKGIQESNVLVVFDLPDGSQGESTFKLGDEIISIISRMQSNACINYSSKMKYDFLNGLERHPTSIPDTSNITINVDRNRNAQLVYPHINEYQTT